MTEHQKILIGCALVLNVMSYCVMWFDKYKSKVKGQRISENKLILLAFLLGSFGIYMGMKTPLYHKAAKKKFRIVIPLLFLINIVSFYFLFTY